MKTQNRLIIWLLMLTASLLYFMLRDDGKGKEIAVPTPQELSVFMLACFLGVSALIALCWEFFRVILSRPGRTVKSSNPH